MAQGDHRGRDLLPLWAAAPSDSQESALRIDPMVDLQPPSSPSSTDITVISPPENMEDTDDNFQTPPDAALPHPPSSAGHVSTPADPCCDSGLGFSDAETRAAARSTEAVISVAKEIGVCEAEPKNGTVDLGKEGSELGFPPEREERVGSAEVGAEIVVEPKEMAVGASVVDKDVAEDLGNARVVGSTAVVGRAEEEERGNAEWLSQIQQALALLSRSSETENDDGVDLDIAQVRRTA